MIIINFAHPITKEQRAQIETHAGERITEIRDVPVHFDLQAPFSPQIKAMFDQAGLRGDEWQEQGLLINLPSLNIITAAFLAELHGRIGHFPAVLLIRPSNDQVIRYEVTEIINLQNIRDQARSERHQKR